MISKEERSQVLHPPIMQERITGDELFAAYPEWKFFLEYWGAEITLTEKQIKSIVTRIEQLSHLNRILHLYEYPISETFQIHIQHRMAQHETASKGRIYIHHAEVHEERK